MMNSSSSGTGEKWAQLGSAVAGLMVAYAMFKKYFPPFLQSLLRRHTQDLLGSFYPYVRITFHEFAGRKMERSKLYAEIENYLITHSSTRAKQLKAEAVKDSKFVTLSMDDNEGVTDEFQGVTFWWKSGYRVWKTKSLSYHPDVDERRLYTLTFHKRHRDLVTKSYIPHVMEKGEEISFKNRQRKLYTNSSGDQRGANSSLWNHVAFQHPASFDTLAMDLKKKPDIVNDLITFSKAKDYYARIGKAWKRGYLLYSPPGTGKSTMIAAMANLLDYDVYDLELTAVKDNAQLRKLLIDTTSKSVIVIEDIDCSLELTGQRNKINEDVKNNVGEVKSLTTKGKEKEKEGSKVTLSGLLNFIDGLWSACGSERIIVFTTNYVEKLDPALIRRGRMDKRIELSYCTYESFKVLAKNYHGIDSHNLFDDVEKALGETNMTPADVAESLMPKCSEDEVDSCLKNLLEAIKLAKEEAENKLNETKEKEKETEAKGGKEVVKPKKEKQAKSKDEEENGLKRKWFVYS